MTLWFSFCNRVFPGDFIQIWFSILGFISLLVVIMILKSILF